MKNIIYKKGAVPVLIWVILAIAGMFIANQIGFFSTFIPPYYVPIEGSESLVNPWYYDDASLDYNFPCQVFPLIIRADDDDFSLGWIVLNNNGSLEGYTYISIISFDNLIPDSDKIPKTDNIFLNDGIIFVYKEKRNVLKGCLKCCSPKGSICYQYPEPGVECPWNFPSCKSKFYVDVYDYYKYVKGDVPESAKSLSPCDSCYERYDDGSTGIYPYILSSKYACRDNNIVLQQCSNFGDNTLTETCPLGCESATSQIGDRHNVVNVRCKGKYMPDSKLCVGNKLYKTSSDGNDYTFENCEAECVQDTLINRNTGIKPNGRCIICQNGWERCSGNVNGVELCENNQWGLSETCIGTQSCSLVPGTIRDYRCTSERNPGDERCLLNQPQIMNEQYQWVNNGDACDLSCNMSGSSAVCEKECSNLDEVICNDALGKMQICKDTDRDNEWESYPSGTNGNCVSGQCSSTSESCTPVKNPNQQYCSGGDIWKSIADSSKILEGGVRQEKQKDCLTGCENQSGVIRCIPLERCDGKFGQTICSQNGKKVELCSETGESTTTPENGDCEQVFTGGFCEIIGGSAVCSEPEPDCNGNTECLVNSVYECNSGSLGSKRYDCVQGSLFGLSGGQCIEDSITREAECTDICNSSKPNLCISGNSYSCTFNSTTSQFVPSDLVECESEGCNSDTGLCRTQCSGTKVCVGGIIYSCSSGRLGNITDSCNDLGCNTEPIACTNQCSELNSYKCSGGNSIYCFKNATNNQLMEKTIECGFEECTLSTGKCKTRIPNYPYCMGEAIHMTDAEGYLLPDPRKICSNEPDRGNLFAYCSEGYSDCKYCEEDAYYCNGTQYYQCDDPLTASRKSEQYCEAGCENDCDQLSVLIGSNQNFLKKDPIIIKGTIKGSKSKIGIKTAYSAKIEGSGVSQTKSGLSTSNGELSISFGIQTIGDYKITIELTDFEKTFNVSTKVTNDYVVKLIGEQAVIKIPGATTKTLIEVKDGDGNIPDSVFDEDPSGLIVDVVPSSVLGKWEVRMEGEPGIYDIGLTPIKNQVELTKQHLTVELVKPTLTISSNIPVSSKIGKKSYDIKISGPQLKEGVIKTDSIVPDSITATISKSPAETLTLTSLGGGLYTFEHGFSEIGTYTLNVDASKEGYDSNIFSKQIEISSSGKKSPPGSSGNKTGGVDEPKPPTEPEPIDLKTWIIIIIIIFIIMLGRKKR